MKTKEGMYLVIGILVGIIVILVLLKMPGQPLFAVDPANINSGSSEGVIALTTNVPRTNSTVLWVLDVKNTNLLVYEFINDSALKLKAFRDIKSDLDVPDDYTGFTVERGQWPYEVRKAYKDFKDKYKAPDQPTK